jgi:hypothetical protein
MAGTRAASTHTFKGALLSVEPDDGDCAAQPPSATIALTPSAVAPTHLLENRFFTFQSSLDYFFVKGVRWSDIGATDRGAKLRWRIWKSKNNRFFKGFLSINSQIWRLPDPPVERSVSR